MDTKETHINRAVVHPTRNQAIIKGTKTASSERIVPLADSLIELLNPLEDHGFIVGGEHPLSYQQQKLSFKKIRNELGLQEYTAHDFRNTCATEWQEQGMTIQAVSKLLGHATTTITEKCYVKFREQGMTQARAIMNEAYPLL